MKTSLIGRIVTGSLSGGIVLAPTLVLVGPIAGAGEHVITGTILLTLAASWALLVILSTHWTEHPQRWAAGLAGYMAVSGAGLLLLAPSGSAIGTLGWVWPPLVLSMLAGTVARVRRELHSRSRSLVVYPMLATYALAAGGGFYETISEARQHHMHAAQGVLVDVGRRALHLSCSGSGTPTVILESGLGEGADYWRRIHAAVARETRVCAYDRAGRGWSDPAPVAQDGIAVATDLHMLLERASVPGPFVLVGHSSGAQYVRIFANRYPREVAGVVLLDGQPAEVFGSLPPFPSFYNRYRRIVALFPSLARLGVGRLVNDAEHASPGQYRSLRDEFAELPASLAEAHSSRNLGDRPLVVVTCSRDALEGWLPLQEKLATLSTNASHRVVPYTHDELVSDEAGARESTQAIHDVVHAVRFATPLNQGE